MSDKQTSHSWKMNKKILEDQMAYFKSNYDPQCKVGLVSNITTILDCSKLHFKLLLKFNTPLSTWLEVWDYEGRNINPLSNICN